MRNSWLRAMRIRPPHEMNVMPSLSSSAGPIAANPTEQAPISAAASPPRKHIPSLDGLRAFSIILVLLSHTRLNGVVPGGFGVTIFFFLSGYLITTLLRLEYESTGSINISHFYIRRSLRIFPPLYAVVALSLLIAWAGWLPNTVSWPGLSANLFYYTNYYMIFSQQRPLGLIPGLSTLWSLAVEEHFYLVFPIIYVALVRMLPGRGMQCAALGLLWFAISAWRCALVWGWHVSVIRAQLATDTRLDSILAGCMLAIYGNPFLDHDRFSRRAWKGLLWTACIALIASFFLPGAHLRETLRYSIQNIALIPVFICAIRFPDWAMFRLLNNRHAKMLGLLSYGIYLLHGPIFEACNRVVENPFLQAGVGIALSIVAAWGLYELVEKPTARLRQRLA